MLLAPNSDPGVLGRLTDAQKHENQGSDSAFQIDDPLMHSLHEQSSVGMMLVTQAKIASTLGARERAGDLLRRAVQVDPNHKDIRFAIANFLSEPGKADKHAFTLARSHLEAGLKLAPKYAKLRHKYAWVLDQLGDTAGARAQWEQIVGEEPQHALALVSLGDIYLRKGQRDRAFDMYRKGLAVPPDTAFSLGAPALEWYQFALITRKAGLVEESLGALRQALALRPYQADIYDELIKYLRELERPSEIPDVLRLVVDHAPQDLDIRQRLADALIENNRFDEAVVELQGILAKQPENQRAIVALTTARMKAKNYAAAIPLLRGLLRDRPPRAALLHMHLGTALLETGQTDAARAELETALRMQPQLKEARALLDRLASP